MLAILIALASPALAEAPSCGPRAVAIAMVQETFGETLRTRALTSSGMVSETYANDATGTWTILVTAPDGTTCLGAEGIMFQAIPTGEPL